MGSQELSVSWKDHSSVLVAVFEKLLSNKSLVDCTVAAEGQYLRVHKVVLSACSPYFEVLLNEDTDKHPIIILRDVKFEDLKRIIDFVYRGEVKLPEDQLVEFLNVAESLQIKGLGAGSNEASGKRKFTEDLFSKKKVESSKPQKRSRNQLSDSENVVKESVPSTELGSQIDDSDPPWHQSTVPSTAQVPSTVDSQPMPTNVFTTPSKANTQDNFPSSEAKSDQVTVPPEPVLPSSSAVVKVEFSPDDSLGAKDDFTYETINEAFSEDSYVMDSENQAVQPSTSHQYSQLPSTHLPSGSLTADNSLAASQVVEQGHAEGAASDAPLLLQGSNTATTTQRPSAPLPPPPPPLPAKKDEEGAVDSKSALHHLFGVSSPYLSSSSGAAAGVPPAPPPRLPNPLSRAFPATRLRSAAASILSPQNRLHRYHHQGYFFHHHRGGGGGTTAVPKRHYCPECRKPCPSPWYLQRHMRTHTGEKPYRCDSCEMAFSNADNLRRHRRKHTGEDQPFPCEDCGEAFARISALRAHQRAAHTGERPYRCDVCDEAFKQSGHLARHKRTHERHEAVAAAALEAALAGGAPPLDVSGVLHVELVCGEGDAGAGAS